MPRVLIAGASSDIGLALCRRYLDEGWEVVGHYRTRRPEFDAFVSRSFMDWKCDFSDISELEKVIERQPEQLQNIDSFVNLAAELKPLKFEDAKAADILRAISVNALPGIILMQALAPAMLRRGFGRFVHASSIGVKYGGGSQSYCYSLSKHMQEFIPGSCRAWAASGVYVNVLRIGVTDTRIHAHLPERSLAERVEKIPVQRAARPEEIAEALFWYGSEKNTFTTNQVIAVAGGE